MTSLNSARPVMQWNERGVSVAIWKRQHEGGTFYDISISRSYKKAETWHRTSYFRGDDLTTRHRPHHACERLLGQASRLMPPGEGCPRGSPPLYNLSRKEKDHGYGLRTCQH